MKYQTADTSSYPRRALIREVKCPRRCGWVRPYTDSPRWLQRYIDHPQWGRVTQMQAVQSDVFFHDCTTAAQASARARKLFGKPRKERVEQWHHARLSVTEALAS